MNSWQTFFYMGGYAFYVWTAYAIVIITLIITFVWPILRNKKIIANIKAIQKRQEKLAKRNPEQAV